MINGDFTVNGGQTAKGCRFPIRASTGTVAKTTYLVVWVKGKYTTSGNGVVSQGANTNVTWIVDNDITTSGNSYSNSGAGSRAANTLFVQPSGTYNVATQTWSNQHKITISGTGDWIGQINAPSATVVVSYGGSLVGALIADNLNVSGGSGFHYDEALSTKPDQSIGNYAFASWFEDNSAPKRSIYY